MSASLMGAGEGDVVKIIFSSSALLLSELEPHFPLTM